MPQYSANPFLLFVIVLIIFLKPWRTRDELRIEKRTGEQQFLSFMSLVLDLFIFCFPLQFDLFFFFFLVFDFSITFSVFALHRFLFRLIFLFLTAVFLCYLDFDLFPFLVIDLSIFFSMVQRGNLFLKFSHCW